MTSVAVIDVLVAAVLILAAVGSRDETLGSQLGWLSAAALVVVVSFAAHVSCLFRLRAGIAVLAKRLRETADD